MEYAGITYTEDQIVTGSHCVKCEREDGLVWLLPEQIFCVHCGQEYNVPANWRLPTAPTADGSAGEGGGEAG